MPRGEIHGQSAAEIYAGEFDRGFGCGQVDWRRQGYSRLARRDVVKARDFIAARGYDGTADDIRLCRQQLLEQKQEFSAVIEAEDSFSVSTCRDLIFNVQEHRMAMSEIANFLHENRLTFLGFEFEYEGEVLNVCRRRFPGDPAAIDLGNWQAFEEENPQLFSRTYLFWVQKTLLSGT